MYTPVNKPPLSITHPNLVTEWDYDKNNTLGIYPDKIRYGSNKKVWWICQHGHEWCASVASRTNKQSGCPVCAGQKVLVGFNDLATLNPKLALEWHPTKNGDLKPSDVTQGSNRKVWWMCEHGHEWQTTIAHRTNKSRPRGCPVCAGQKVLVGFNDLATLNPNLALEWHPTKNGDLKPTQVTVSSMKKVWWICQHGHEWYASINSRTNKSHQNGCPVCAGRQVLVGFNDLATLNPTVASDWHPTKNGNLKSSDVTVSSGRKVWWMCKHGHEWYASVASRTNKSQPSGCPVCAGQKVLVGFNDLATVNPNLALEWHPTKNGNLTPSDVTQGSEKKVWWVCKHGHEWQAMIYSRTNLQSGCPVCSGRQVLAGFNDLATVNPNLASEWHPTKNGNLTPSDVTQGSEKKVWWVCKHGHEWQTSINNRTNKQSGCSVCARLATVSYPESIVSYYMQSLGINCILQASNASIPQLENMSVDLYLPAYNLAIEYDGSFYHPEGIERKQRDYKKDAALVSSGIKLIRIRDDAEMKKPFTCARLKHYVSYRYSCKNQDHENLKFVIQDIITNQLHLPNKLDFDLVRDKDAINKIKDCMNQSVNIQISK